MKQFEGFYFDLDGTIYAGTELLDGAASLLEALNADGKKIAFLTNNSTWNRRTISERLMLLGINANPEQIICPTDYAGRYILEYHGKSSVYVIGSEQLKENVEQSGHVVRDDTQQPCDIVLVGRDLQFNYLKLEEAAIHLQRGAKLIATNMDASHPIQTGERVPETGALIAAIQKTFAVDAEVIGKPSAYLFDQALNQYNLSPDQAIMIGDNPATDIKGGRLAGLWTTLLSNDPSPPDVVVDYTFNSLLDILSAYDFDLVKEG